MGISQKSQEIINNHALAAAGVGIPGILFPAADMAGMAVIWGKMLVEVARESGHEVDLKFAGKIITSMTAGVTLYIGGGKLMTWLLNFIPGIGTLTSAGINAMFNWIYTLRLGRLLAEQFQQPGFTPAMLVISASGIASLVFALPSIHEFRDAFHAISHLLHIGSQVSEVAQHTSTAADLASHGTSIANHAMHAAHVVAHSSDIHFGGLHTALAQVTGTTIPPDAVNHQSVLQFLRDLLPHAQQHAPHLVSEMQQAITSGAADQMQHAATRAVQELPRWTVNHAADLLRFKGNN